MKKYITLFSLSLIMALGASAQTGGLKGPAAKNYKPWKNPAPAKAVVIASKEDVKGPEAKNNRPFQNKEVTLAKASTEVKTERNTGPHVKNAKPWNK